MDKRKIFKIYEPLNKEIDYMLLALYEHNDGRNKFALPANHQNLRDSYCYMNLDAINIMESTNCHDSTENNDNEIFEHDILEIFYNGKTITSEVKKEACGFLLASNEFPDGYIWLTELLECDCDYFWIKDSKIVGNKFQSEIFI